MKKILYILLGICILTVIIIFYLYNTYFRFLVLSEKLNKEYENYTENVIVGSSLMSLINKSIDLNEKNNVEKNKQGLYIENDTNSIKIEIKFAESDKTFQMEAISKLGSSEFIKNYNSRSFKCTKKEFHSKTGQIKYMLFEEVI